MGAEVAAELLWPYVPFIGCGDVLSSVTSIVCLAYGLNTDSASGLKAAPPPRLAGLAGRPRRPPGPGRRGPRRAAAAPARPPDAQREAFSRSLIAQRIQ